MLSRDDFRFVLLPWEHRGTGFDARPDFVATAKVEQIEQEFLLKVRANRVFFRFAEDETRVWGTMGEVEGDVVSFWQREVESERFGRLFSRSTFLNAVWDITLMEVLVCSDGSALLCEWCSDVWWQGEPSPELQDFARTRYHINVWHPAWRPGLRELMTRNRALIRNRLMPADERETTRKRWTRGSSEELARLLKLFCTAHSPLLNRASFAPGRIDFSFHGAWAGQEASLALEHVRDLKQFPMLDVFVEHNQTWGVEWQTWTQKTNEERRGDWQSLSGGLMLDFQKTQPSFHEQLEARLRLREWLRDQVSAEQIEAWLDF